MMGSTLRRGTLLVAAFSVASLALAQEPAMPPPHWGFIATMAAMGMAMVVAIVFVALLHDRSVRRERLTAIERLVASDKPVPRELITGEVPPLPLPQEYRRDVRRGITLLCWAIAVALIPIIGSGGEWRYGVWGLLFLLPSLGSFFKAWLTAREIARGASNGSPQL